MASCFGCCKKSGGERMTPISEETLEAPLKSTNVEKVVGEVMNTPIEKALPEVEETKAESQFESALNSSPILKSVAQQFGLIDSEKNAEEGAVKDSTIKDETVSENVKKAIEDLKDDGLLIIKHSRDGKPRSRIIGLTDDERKLTWKDPKKSLGAFIKLKDDRTVSLSQVTEVRPATALDPSTVGEKRPQGKGGTATFRKSEAGAKVAKRAFSLITASRTFDIECKDEDQVKILISTFKYLVAQAKAAPDTPVKPTPTETTPAKNTSE